MASLAPSADNNWTRIGWDWYFIGIAESVAVRADCRRRQHGAVIVRDNRIVATGYNGAPAGKPGCLSGACPRGLLSYDEVASLSSYDDGPGQCIAVHAEVNALLYADHASTVGATMYITGQPCSPCAKILGGAQLARVVYLGADSTIVEMPL